MSIGPASEAEEWRAPGISECVRRLSADFKPAKPLVYTAHWNDDRIARAHIIPREFAIPQIGEDSPFVHAASGSDLGRLK